MSCVGISGGGRGMPEKAAPPVVEAHVGTEKRETKRLTANLPLDAAQDLETTANLTGFNKLTTLVRAIRVFADLIRVTQDGGEVIIKEAHGTRSRLVLR
jgi:hypothetical protein